MKLHKWLQYSFAKELSDYIKTGVIPKWVTRAPSTTKWKTRSNDLEDILYNIIKSVDYNTGTKYNSFIKIAKDSSDEYDDYIKTKVCEYITDISKYALLLKQTIYDRHKYIRTEYKKHQEKLLKDIDSSSERYKAAQEILQEETMYIETLLQKEFAKYIHKFQIYSDNKLQPLISGLKMLNITEVPRNYHKTFSEYIHARRSLSDSYIIKAVKNELVT